MSAPRKIWATSPKADRYFPARSFSDGRPSEIYHHDDVVRELVEALEAIVKKDTRMHGGGMAPDSMGCCGQIARAALAKIAQEDRG